MRFMLADRASDGVDGLGQADTERTRTAQFVVIRSLDWRHLLISDE